MYSKRGTKRAEYAPEGSSVAFRDARRHTVARRVHYTLDSIVALIVSAGQWQSRRKQFLEAERKWSQMNATAWAPNCQHAHAFETTRVKLFHAYRH